MKKTSQKKNLKPFESPVYITRPLLPDIADMTAKLEEIWASKWLTNKGPQHELLENELKKKLKAPHLSLFNNGTIALITACRALRLSGGVITTPFTFPATPHVLTWNNISPVFCDIDPDTMNITADKIEELITPDITAILGVHIFGAPCDVEKIQDIADRYGLKVIYDAAHAFGVEIGGTGIGGFGDISMFSFHATKMFHTAEGGALTFNDPDLKQRIDFLKNFGIKNEEEVVMPGINGKMNEIQAAVGLLVLKHIEGEVKKRKILTETYVECLKGTEGLAFLKDIPRVKRNYQYFVLRINEKLFGRSRDFVYDKLKEYNVFSRKYFHPLCSDYACYRRPGISSAVNFPEALRASREVLCLPNYGALSTDDAVRIGEMIKSLGK